MKLALVTDAWLPQVNGVVTTLVELARELRGMGHEIEVIHPGMFETRPCPGYAGIDLARRPGRRLAEILGQMSPDAIHLATEGPLGWAARRYCIRHGWAFTTAFHTKFPEILKAAAGVPLWAGYAAFRHFHRPSSGVLVPTSSVLRGLQRRGFQHLRPWTHGVDLSLFDYVSEPADLPGAQGLPRPIHLFVGRVSYEKNIQAFLRLPLRGTKVVCGVGPLLDPLRRQHPDVHWMGVLPRDQLARVYASADVFVFPSHADTFGLVMLEAMACGTPVAAFPVDGPLEVIGQSPAGVMHGDLGHAIERALAIPRHEARARALAFSWTETARRFLSHLVPARGTPVVTPSSWNGAKLSHD